MRITRPTLSCLNISLSICAAFHPYRSAWKEHFQETDRVIEHLIGNDTKRRLDNNLNVLSHDCHWYSYRLAGSSAICQITPLTIPPAVKGRPSFHYVITYLKKMFPESPRPASKESINIGECHMGRLIEFTFNQTAHALTVMTKQQPRYIWKQIFKKNKKWKKNRSLQTQSISYITNVSLFLPRNLLSLVSVASLASPRSEKI